MRDAAIETEPGARRGGTARATPRRQRGDLSSAAVAAERLGGVIDRQGAPSRVKGRRGGKRRWAIPAAIGRVRPVKALTSVAFAAALVGIVANAVLFQRGRETGTPLDALRGMIARAPSPPPRTAAPDDAAPAPAAAPAPPPPAPASAPPAASATAEPAPAVTHRGNVAKRAGPKPAGGDAIGRLLGASPADAGKAGSGGTGAAGDKPAGTKPDPTLIRAQRELKALGYAVKPDGHMDGDTRQAFRRFAHDHHLKDEATLTPALRREIADASSATKPAPSKPKAQ